MGEHGDDVAHGARGQEHRRLLAEEGRDAVAQRVDGWIVAVLLVAHLGGIMASRMAGVGRVCVSE